MATAIILMNIEHNRIKDVAEELASVPGISEVYSVSGRHDLAAIVRVASTEKLAELVTERLWQIQGVTNTETMFAFQTFSRHDLDRMFSIGM